jgi:hypothetical protein
MTSGASVLDVVRSAITAHSRLDSLMTMEGPTPVLNNGVKSKKCYCSRGVAETGTGITYLVAAGFSLRFGRCTVISLCNNSLSNFSLSSWLCWD